MANIKYSENNIKTENKLLASKNDSVYSAKSLPGGSDAKESA